MNRMKWNKLKSVRDFNHNVERRKHKKGKRLQAIASRNFFIKQLLGLTK